MQSLQRELRYAKEEAINRPGSYKSEQGPTKYVYRETSAGGITSEEEKNHVIKVLEHESKVYRFEKNLLGLNSGEGDYYSEQGRTHHRYDL